MATCKFCGVPITWAQDTAGRWVPADVHEDGLLYDHRPACEGTPMSVDAADNARRYAWARFYESQRTVNELEEVLRIRDEADATCCIECDERPPVVDGLCDPCLKAHYGVTA